MRAIVDRYLRIDARSLGLFRAAFALVLLSLGTVGIVFENTIAPYAFGLVGLLFASATGFLRTLPDFLATSDDDTA